MTLFWVTFSLILTLIFTFKVSRLTFSSHFLRLVETENKLALSEEECEEYEKEQNRLNKKVESLETSLKTAENERAQSEQKIKEITEQLKDCKKQNEEFEDQLEKRNEEIEEYKNLVSVLKEETNEKERLIQAMKEKSTGLFDRLEQLEDLLKGKHNYLYASTTVKP